LKLPTSSFFFVSTEMTGCCFACAATTFVLMCSNCAFRSGCFRLAIKRAREAEFQQLLVHGIGTDRMAHRRQRRRQLVHALRYPDQWPHRIAQRRGLDEAFQLVDKLRVVLSNGPTPTAGAANPAFRQRFGVEIVLAAIDRRAGEPGDPRHNRQTAPPGGLDLGRREHAPSPFVKLAADRIPAKLNGVLVDHAIDVRLFANIRNPGRLSHTDARPQTTIQLLFEMS
jgi:hypothetical protein